MPLHSPLFHFLPAYLATMANDSTLWNLKAGYQRSSLGFWWWTSCTPSSLWISTAPTLTTWTTVLMDSLCAGSSLQCWRAGSVVPLQSFGFANTRFIAIIELTVPIICAIKLAIVWPIKTSIRMTLTSLHCILSLSISFCSLVLCALL